MDTLKILANKKLNSWHGLEEDFESTMVTAEGTVRTRGLFFVKVEMYDMVCEHKICSVCTAIFQGLTLASRVITPAAATIPDTEKRQLYREYSATDDVEETREASDLDSRERDFLVARLHATEQYNINKQAQTV